MKTRMGPDGPMKFCPGCRMMALGWEQIHASFDKDSRRPDGYRLYCKGCRRLRRIDGKGR